MDKKTLIGLLIVGVILFGYSFYNSKQAAKYQEEVYRADSIDRAEHPERYAESLPESAESQALRAELEARQQADEQAKQDALIASLGESLVAASQAEAQTYLLENDVMKVWISSRGGEVTNVELKDYTRGDLQHKGDPLMLFKEGSAKFDMELFIKRSFNTAQINTTDYVFTDARITEQPLADDGGVSRSLSLRLPVNPETGAAIEYVYTLYPNDYMVNFDVNFIGMEPYTSNLTFFTFDWEATSLQNEKGFKNENMYTTVAYRFPDARKIHELGASDGEKEEKITTKVNWVSFKQQFFSSIFIADDNFADASFGYKTAKPNSGEIKDFAATFTVPYDPAQTNYAFLFYFGPNQYSILRSYDLKLEKVIPLGGSLISWINTGLTINVFNWLSKFISSYGIIILILTIMVKLIILPLTYKSYMSSAKMRVLQPEIAEINARYPNQEDALKKQQAIMALYKRCGVNPMGGCLPMLIQLPVLIAMFRFFPSSIELRGQHFLWADDLSSYDSVLNLPFNIPFYGDHVSLFTLLMALALFFYSKMTYKQTEAAGPQMAGMKFMTLYLMPILMLCWFNSYASGLTYYYLLSQLFTILIMWIIRYSVNEEKLLAKLQDNAAKSDRNAASKPKSKWQLRYEEALRQQQEMQRQRQQQAYGGSQKTHTAKPQSTKNQPPKKRRK